MSDVLSWPALNPGAAALPAEIPYEHGVWGKAPGARTDFRWIARSGGFRSEAREVSLGTEEQPEKAQLWRSLDDRCLAAGFYESRAVDATGRKEFLEKQVLAWQRPKDVPAALGALLVLPEAESLTDEVWWGRSSDRAWEDPAFCLPLPTPEPIPVQRERLEAALRQGVDELRKAIDLENLKRLYAQILARRRPALLTGLERPLSARALAVLLLPLPRSLADSLSLAGWIPSSRVSPESLDDRWDVIVLPPHLKGSIDLGEVHPEMEAQSWALAAGLLNLDLDLVEPAAAAVDLPPATPAAKKQVAQRSRPSPLSPLSPIVALRPRALIPLPAPPDGASPLLRELHAFAEAIHRRWLDPDDMRLTPETVPDQLFPSWIEGLAKPEHADEDQWKVKRDLLRSAALALRPKDDTLQSVGPFESRRVPALFFAQRLDHRDLLAKLSEEPLRQIIRQSLSCQPDSRTRQVRIWLAQTKSRKSGLTALIARELESVKAP